MGKFPTVDDYVAAQEEPLRSIGAALVRIIDAALPGTGAMWQGHPVWSLGAAPGRNPVCLLKAYKSYVTFGFWRGRELDDPTGRMQTASGMAHVKLRTVADIDAALFAAWLKQAGELERRDLPAQP
jgi:hypothetical protein